MRNNRSTTWFLLGYLTLLLNVGQSAHHADFFGFHAHGATPSSSHAHVHRPGQSAGGCCCSHAHPKSTSPSRAEDSTETVANLSTDNSCHNCLLCQYFDHFHAVASSIDFKLDAAPTCESLPPKLETVLFRSIKCSARGPPALLS